MLTKEQRDKFCKTTVVEDMFKKEISMRFKGKFTFSVNWNCWAIGVSYYHKEWASIQIGPVFVGYDNEYIHRPTRYDS